MGRGSSAEEFPILPAIVRPLVFHDQRCRHLCPVRVRVRVLVQCKCICVRVPNLDVVFTTRTVQVTKLR